MVLETFIAVCLGLILLVAALIDWRRMILPDWITLPLIPLGCAMAAMQEPPLTDRLIGAVAGFAVFAGIAELYRRLRGHDGLGMGDAKLLAAAGAWVGWRDLPLVVLGGAVTALAWALATRRDPERPLPFGPFLAATFWLVWRLGGSISFYGEPGH